MHSHSFFVPCRVHATLRADNVYGALCGLETFAQLVDGSLDSPADRLVSAVFIEDSPRFPYATRQLHAKSLKLA
jgi:hypothetical protein